MSEKVIKHLMFKAALIVGVLSFFAFTAIAQQRIEVTLGPDEVGEHGLWPITITVHNGQLKSYDKFPDIPGLRKRDESHRESTSYINGKVSSFQSRTMTYSPMKKGTINIPSFTMTVNGETIKVQGKKVVVKSGSVRQQPGNQQRTPGFFDQDEPEYIEVEDDAFLAVTTDKSEVYVGEGVNTTLAFYRSENNRAILQFYDISRQLTDILKKLKPANCWEENFNIEDIEGERVTINGKDYIRFKIYEAVYYPFNTEPIKFPAVGLEMIKYKVARRPSFFSPNSKEGYKTFTSQPKTVTVKELPPHPLKNSVAVGEFKLAEHIAKTEINTGESTSYEFNVLGEGNIASLPNPITKADNNIEIYDPNVRQEISKGGGRIHGTKSFRYFLIPKEPGTYNLSKYFKWIYFSPSRKQYDTLTSKLVVNISGESKRNEAIESYDPGNFYDGATVADNSLRVITNDRWQRYAFQGFVVLMMGASAFLLFRKS